MSLLSETLPRSRARSEPDEPVRVKEAVRALEFDILFGRLKPRERLVEDALMARFSAKRHVVRRALDELAQMGIVVRSPNRGATVRDFTAQEVEDAYELRDILQRGATQRMPLPADRSMVAGLTAIQRRHDAAVEAADLRLVDQVNDAFHRLMFGACGNVQLAESIARYAPADTCHAGLSHGRPGGAPAAARRTLGHDRRDGARRPRGAASPRIGAHEAVARRLSRGPPRDRRSLGELEVSAHPGDRPPEGACDCHVHIFRPDSFPYAAARTYTPPAATVDDLRDQQAALGLSRAVIVQPSVYGTDNRCLADALRQLGGRARGVAVINAETRDETLDDLAACGVRGVRLNLENEGLLDPEAAWDRLRETGARVRPRGWHVQVLTSLAVVAALADRIEALGVPLVLDHFGGARAAAGPEQPGFACLLRLLERGHVHVKLSAAYRISERPDWADLSPLARALIAAAPDRVLWASDWPHPGPRQPGERDPDIDPFHLVDDAQLLALLSDHAPDPTTRRAILVDNPARLYGFGAAADVLSSSPEGRVG